MERISGRKEKGTQSHLWCMVEGATKRYHGGAGEEMDRKKWRGSDPGKDQGGVGGRFGGETEGGR